MTIKRPFCIGHGYDVHRLVPDRKFILGGVEIPWEKGLLGHSDADVLVHAVMDAILGALGLGDIGLHFPDSDLAYAGVDSCRLLAHVRELMEQQGYTLGNLDCTVIAQRPKLRPHIPEMTRCLAEILGAEPAQINLKATTEEGLGFCGREEGVAAHAMALLMRTDYLNGY